MKLDAPILAIKCLFSAIRREANPSSRAAVPAPFGSVPAAPRLCGQIWTVTPYASPAGRLEFAIRAHRLDTLEHGSLHTAATV